MRQVRKLPPTALILAGAMMSCVAHAQPSDPYFKGKTVTIAVGGTAGGGIDIGARLLARYLGKYLPGEPKVQVQLVPGAGGVRLIEQLYRWRRGWLLHRRVLDRADHRAADFAAQRQVQDQRFHRGGRDGEGRQRLRHLAPLGDQDAGRCQGARRRRHRRRLRDRSLSARAQCSAGNEIPRHLGLCRHPGNADGNRARRDRRPLRLGLFQHAVVEARLASDVSSAGAFSLHTQENTVDKDRIKGAAEQAKGKVKEVAGKVAVTASSKAKARPIRLLARSGTPSAASRTLFAASNQRPPSAGL